ncbi:uncharacterized protein K489DRAFT_380920 [Dissoconium aciculare CBS 342.82]|uniref:Uncharacterized protein n=1 Tax=Dissoconium aciculare CBS 342.82 TaxID=1314786 RepID=A0A6J3M5Q7_9PEZI|nr:uncharacterized protein K489DRAFT_380920 [Dissoconium aciculare CBS 342.82]KAF1822177.1 hypothetical protein K489DRAFT_380920 [Dissoconium aciculare CBS 342.82]
MEFKPTLGSRRFVSQYCSFTVVIIMIWGHHKKRPRTVAGTCSPSVHRTCDFMVVRRIV